jgi:N-acetylneuraminic acid mutarotase
MRALRRLVRFVLRLLIVVVIAVALAVVILRLTNPSPEASIGWNGGAPMPDARGETASAVVDGRLVVVGGLRGVTTVSDAVSIYDIERDRWTRGPTLSVGGRHHAAAAAADGRVYLSGGASSVTDWTARTDLVSFDPDGGWAPERAMPEGRQGHAMVAIGDELYVVGGAGGTDRTLIYDISNSRWSFGAPLPEGRDHIRAVVWEGRIWALGGRDGEPTRRVDIYDPETDEWSSGPPLPEAMSAMAVGILREELFVVGGEDPRFIRGHVSNDHFMLALTEPDRQRRWVRRPQPMLAVHGGAYGTSGRSLVTAGGASRHGALSIVSWTNVTQVFNVLPRLHATEN